MCLNKPIQIPTGSNGKSVFIAYASTSTGTGFSYTPTDDLDYISFVTKTGTVTSADFTTWTKFQGTDGINGTNGISITNTYVSDGTTPIGGVVYALNTVVVLLSSGIYINSGLITLPTLIWNNVILINGWGTFSILEEGPTVKGPAQYAISNGFLYLRGSLKGSAASSSTFTNIGMSLSIDAVSTISDCDTTTPVFSRINFNINNSIQIVEYLNGNSVWELDSVNPISLR